MSESSLVVEWQEEEEVVEEVADPKPGVNGHLEPPRYVSECRMEPRCLPSGYSSTVLCRRDSTWRRFVEEVRFEVSP
ncbi:ATP-binding cassette sub-family A member 13, partial [Frankliniella fusca]